VNLLGSLIVGLLLGVLGVERLTSQAPSDHSWVRPLVLIGFLGAFTTFSSWSLETTLLLQKGELWKALFNIVGSMALGLLLTGIGVWAGQLLVNR
jgi:CrcB protein